MNVFSIKAILSLNPMHKSLDTVALNIWSSVLNHHPYPISNAIYAKISLPIANFLSILYIIYTT